MCTDVPCASTAMPPRSPIVSPAARASAVSGLTPSARMTRSAGTSGADGDQYSTSSYLDYLDIRERNEVFSDMMGFSPMMAASSFFCRS